MRADEYVALREGRQAKVESSGTDRWKVTCPSHADAKPSLSVRQSNGRILLHCFAGCDLDSVLAADGLEKRDLFDDDDYGQSKREITAYDYVDESGTLLFQVVRCFPKSFPQRRPDGNGGWIWKLGDTRRVLYRLPNVLSAARQHKPIYVVEGEKDVQAVERAGAVATCNPGGAGKWRDEYADALVGASKIIIVADDDQAGYDHAREVAASCRSRRVPVEIVKAAKGKDVHDHLAAGLGLDALVPSGPDPREPDQYSTPQGDPRYAGRRVDIAALLARPDTPTRWRCHEIVADGTLTILTGRSGDGKSWLALRLAAGVARGEVVAGIACKRGTALIIDGEMGEQMYIKRLRKAGIGPEIELRDAMGLDLSLPRDLQWLRGEIEGTKARLVVIDSLRRLVPSKRENDSDDMAPTVASLAKLARDTDSAILLVHHMGDSEDKFYRGSSAIKDQADALFALLRDDEEDDLRRLTCREGKGKMRYEAEPDDRYFHFAESGITNVDAPEPRKPTPSRPTREYVKAEILNNLPAPTKAEVARRLDRRRHDDTFLKAWTELEREDSIVKDGGSWRRSVPAGVPWVPAGQYNGQGRLSLPDTSPYSEGNR
jgi:hypothetical protein